MHRIAGRARLNFWVVNIKLFAKSSLPTAVATDLFWASGDHVCWLIRWVNGRTQLVAVEDSRFSTWSVGQSTQSVQKRQRMLCPVLLRGFFLCFFWWKLGQRIVGNVFTRDNIHAKRHRDKILQSNQSTAWVLPRRQRSQLKRRLQNCGTERMVWILYLKST